MSHATLVDVNVGLVARVLDEYQKVLGIELSELHLNDPYYLLRLHPSLWIYGYLHFLNAQASQVFLVDYRYIHTGVSAFRGSLLLRLIWSNVLAAVGDLWHRSHVSLKIILLQAERDELLTGVVHVKEI